MKPTKNRIFCKACGRTKMLFETEKKAQLFMKFNNEEIASENDTVPARAYFCELCGGWHLTHFATVPKGASRTEQMIEHLNTSKEIRKVQKKKESVIKTANTNYAISQLSEIDKYIANSEYTLALEVLDALLEMSKTKYIKPKLMKQIRAKKELVKSLQNM